MSPSVLRREAAVRELRWGRTAAAAVVLILMMPSAAGADPLPTITLDRDGPVTLLVQSGAPRATLGLAIASRPSVGVCSDCRSGETAQLGTLSRGTEIVLRLT